MVEFSVVPDSVKVSFFSADIPSVFFSLVAFALGISFLGFVSSDTDVSSVMDTTLVFSAFV